MLNLIKSRSVSFWLKFTQHFNLDIRINNHRSLVVWKKIQYFGSSLNFCLKNINIKKNMNNRFNDNDEI